MSGPTHRSDVRDLVASIVATAILPIGGRVLRARSWPVQMSQLPAALVYGWEESKESRSVTSPDERYAVTCIMAVQCRAAAADPEDLEADLEQLAGLICDAVLRAPGLVGREGIIERIASVKTTFEISRESSDDSLGGVSLAFEMRWSEDYPPVADEGGIFCTETEINVHLPFGGP